ncbi:helix-turn-helix transcriptional regulator [Streptomyces sp. NPDC093094]|uniref:helix-turn-helix transcriptional regulator n=1 Tax=Streptomyces sp. NPDC093094 TaxID=3366026 RepID=UPI00382D96DB
MSPATHPSHGADELCPPGTRLYEQALREGQVGRADTEAAAPCLLDHGLLQPAVTDPHRLEPVAPALALHRMLHASAQAVAEQRNRETRLAEAFEPLMRLGGHTGGSPAAIGILTGMTRINEAISQAMAEATGEMLCIQPAVAGISPQPRLVALVRDQAVLDRGLRIRTLYQHTQRHMPLIAARYEQLRGDAQARTLDEIPDRLIIVDRTVAFIPASPDRTLALAIRIPALVDHLATVFDRLWRLATPMHPEAVRQPTLNGITPRQRAIAVLLVEGHTDAVIAGRLGMNIRTARIHIAKLAATLGSDSRAQLGYLIARSGILDQEGAHP